MTQKVKEWAEEQAKTLADLHYTPKPTSDGLWWYHKDILEKAIIAAAEYWGRQGFFAADDSAFAEQDYNYWWQWIKGEK